MRQEFSRKTKAEAFRLSGGRCEICTRKLRSGDIHYDHRNPDGLTGEPTLVNCQVLCTSCHKTKTFREDIPAIRRAQRKEAAHIGARVRRGRPMPGSKASGWKKKFDGTIERRDP